MDTMVQKHFLESYSRSRTSVGDHASWTNARGFGQPQTRSLNPKLET
jgi:hypothetical protein